jgi:YidC/Oxa1 family membrane protein insertase
MSEDQKRAFMAVALSGLILFGWQYFFGAKPQVNHLNDQQIVNSRENFSSSDKLKNQNLIHSDKLNNKNQFGSEHSVEYDKSVTSRKMDVDNERGQESFFELTNYLEIIDFSSNRKSSTSKNFFDTNVPFEILFRISEGENSFAKIPFTFVSADLGANSSSSNQVLINDKLGIKVTVSRIDKYGLNFSLESKSPIQLQFQLNSSVKEVPGHLREYLVYGNDVTRTKVTSNSSGENVGNWFGMDFNHQLFAVDFYDKEAFRYNVNENGGFAANLTDNRSHLKWRVLFLEKNYDNLLSLGHNLHLSVDFGWFGVIAVPVLRALQFLYKYIPNYGIAIIILTLLLKILTFPLQYKSYKGMKKMQQLQPELNKLKELYKGDPQKMQKESLELFKRAGANPLSGCLPLLLQTPIFFAFYRVLNSSVELVEAPFFGWITDLSKKDPYFVLPVVMTLVMFIQQKLTPNTNIDQTQQKIMMLMPIIFGFIMKDLPSGLSLYIFVSTFIGIIQQLMVNKMVKV